ncbi:MAG: hypothetical protein GX256_07615, partial [Fretibacterium sp.]|nr:hypothetical protein [Fretibacterium sp.]
MADFTISGIASGIDWNSMLDRIMEKAKKPAYVVLEKRDTLERKKGLFEEMKVAMQKLQSSLAPMKMDSTYKAKEVEIGRLDSNGSYKGVLTATVNADAEVNVHDLEVLQLARSQVQRSNSITGALSGVFTGPLYGLSSAGFWLSTGGRRLRVTAQATDTLASLAHKINHMLKTQETPVGVTASVVDDRLVLKSDR